MISKIENQKDIQRDNINLKQKYNEELDTLLSSVKEVGKIHDELNEMINSQTEKINEIDINIDKTADKVEASNENLLFTLDYKKSLFWKKGGVVTLATVAVATPVAVFIGPKIAIIAGVCTLCGVGYGVA